MIDYAQPDPEACRSRDLHEPPDWVTRLARETVNGALGALSKEMRRAGEDTADHAAWIARREQLLSAIEDEAAG